MTINLQYPRTINSIFISLAEDLANGLQIRVGDNSNNPSDSSNSICYEYPNTASLPTTKWISCPKLKGQYIFLTNSNANYILIEVIEVMAY